LAFEGRETLDDNMCNRFHFGRDILFPKVEVHCTFELLVARCWLLVAGYLMLVAGYWLLVTRYWFLVARCL
jgi:hypothetical protein